STTGDAPPSTPGTEFTPARPVFSEQGNTAVAVRPTGRGRSPSPVVRVARRAAKSPRTARLRGIIGYRLPKAPLGAVRLCWFLLRGHARWIAKGWRWATHGDLRADARAARLVGDREARRAAQELIRADAAARWAKLGIAAHCITLAGLGLTVLGGIL